MNRKGRQPEDSAEALASMLIGTMVFAFITLCRNEGDANVNEIAHRFHTD